jgi:SET domain-containing protein
VEFEEKTVSFRRRMVAVAARDIYSGDRLLTDYGRDFWNEREKDCLCGSEKCISLGLKNGATDGGNAIRLSKRMQREVGRDVANIVDERSKQSAKRLHEAGNGPSNRPSKRRQQ